jgi:hypothetical protein
MAVSRKSQMRKNSKTRGKKYSKRTYRKNFVNRKTKVMQNGGGLKKAQNKTAAKAAKRAAKAARSQAKLDFLQHIKPVKPTLTNRNITGAASVYKKIHMLQNPTYKPTTWYGRRLTNIEQKTATKKLKNVLSTKYKINNSVITSLKDAIAKSRLGSSSGQSAYGSVGSSRPITGLASSAYESVGNSGFYSPIGGVSDPSYASLNEGKRNTRPNKQSTMYDVAQSVGAKGQVYSPFYAMQKALEDPALQAVYAVPVEETDYSFPAPAEAGVRPRTSTAWEPPGERYPSTDSALKRKPSIKVSGSTTTGSNTDPYEYPYEYSKLVNKPNPPILLGSNPDIYVPPTRSLDERKAKLLAAVTGVPPPRPFGPKPVQVQGQAPGEGPASRPSAEVGVPPPRPSGPKPGKGKAPGQAPSSQEPLSRKLTKTEKPNLNPDNAPKYIELLTEKLTKFNAGTQEEIRIESQLKYFKDLLNENPSAAIKKLQENPIGFGNTIDVLLNPPTQ